MDNLAFLVSIILGLRIISDFASGKPLDQYLLGMAVGWAIIHIIGISEGKKQTIRTTGSKYEITF
jgi:hypothetical protein